MHINIVAGWFVLVRVCMSPDRVTQGFLPGRFMDDIVYECSWTGPHTLPHQKIQTFLRSARGAIVNRILRVFRMCSVSLSAMS